MKVQITLRSGAQLLVDMDDLEADKSIKTQQITRMWWTTPEGMAAELHTINLDQIDAIVAFREAPDKGGRR